jgi:hypothetical protein
MRIQWVGKVARTGEGKRIYKVSVRNKPLGKKYIRRWKDKYQIGRQKGWKFVQWTHLATASYCEHCNGNLEYYNI